jgi:hypothetical protein
MSAELIDPDARNTSSLITSVESNGGATAADARPGLRIAAQRTSAAQAAARVRRATRGCAERPSGDGFDIGCVYLHGWSA